MSDYFDVDGDGITDTWAQDSDGDGFTDTYASDTNEDGYLDTWSHDTNADGYVDTFEVDANQDGYIDGSASDLDGDGYIDGGESTTAIAYDDPSLSGTLESAYQDSLDGHLDGQGPFQGTPGTAPDTPFPTETDLVIGSTSGQVAAADEIAEGDPTYNQYY